MGALIERYILSSEKSELDGKYSLNVCVYSCMTTWSVGLCCCMRYCVVYVCNPCVLAGHGLF